MIQIFEKQGDKYVEFPARVFWFPGGEPHCQLDAVPAECHILARVNNPADFVALLAVTNAIKIVHAALEQHTAIHLHIPYFPGARQDRVPNLGEPFTLEMFADIVNAQGYNTVTVMDPHSNKTVQFLDKVNIVDLHPIIKKLIDDGDYNTIIIPDAGATRRINDYVRDRVGLTFIQCAKKRDTVTGKLSGFEVVDRIPQGAKCLILDDICDGGGTFVGLAQEILKNPVQKLSLYVTHGIFSKGVGEPSGLDVFNNIYTTDSFYTKGMYKEHYYPVEVIYEYFK